MTPDYTYRCEVDRVVDGDTISLFVSLGFYVTVQLRVRLLGVNTPERGQPGFADATEFAKGWLSGVEDGDLLVQTEKTGKYGRWLATIFDGGGGMTLNQALLNAGLAEEYGK